MGQKLANTNLHMNSTTLRNGIGTGDACKVEGREEIFKFETVTRLGFKAWIRNIKTDRLFLVPVEVIIPVLPQDDYVSLGECLI